MNSYCAAVEVTSGGDEQYTDYFFVTEVASFEDVMSRVEKYYGEELWECKITFLSDTSFLFLPKEAFDATKKEVML